MFNKIHFFLIFFYILFLLSNSVLNSQNLSKLSYINFQVLFDNNNLNSRTININFIKQVQDTTVGNEQLGISSHNTINFNDTISVYENNLESNSDKFPTVYTDTNRYINHENFGYADTRRYILMGGLPLKETQIKPWTAALFGTALTTTFVLQHQLQMKTIGKEHTPFKFQDDALEELGIDKCGHIYGAYLTSYVFREVFVISGFSGKISNIGGAILGTAYSTYVEVLDGFGERGGFSPSDFVGDIVGGLFFIAQLYYPSLQNITPKFIYVPSEGLGYNRKQPSVIFIDDYSSQFFFYSINIYNILPDAGKHYYPSGLELSVGYTVRNMWDSFQAPNVYDGPCSECISLKDGYGGSPRLVIALDYNVMKLLPDGGNTGNGFKQSLNFFKLPSPAIEIGKITRFYLLFPFKIL